MQSNLSSRSSSPEPIAAKTVGRAEANQGEVKKNAEAKPKRPVSDKQREALKLGMAKLKEKREQLQKEKETRVKTNEELKAKGLPVIEAPIKIKKQDITELPKLEPVELKVKERKVRADKGITRPSAIKAKTDGIEELKKMVMELKQTQSVRVPVQEAPVQAAPVKERVVEKEKVLSGSDLLNKIFFAK
jgi:hypothetical protein